MKINVALSNGCLPDRFGKYAPAADKLHDLPIRSFPIEISELPTDTAALALTLIDYDAVPVAGFPWIHWIAADIAVTNLIPENASALENGMTQGKNSYVSKFLDVDDPAIFEHYSGPKPPTDHEYTLTVYALKEPTNLPKGFYLNDLMRKTEALALDSAQIKIPSRG